MLFPSVLHAFLLRKSEHPKTTPSECVQPKNHTAQNKRFIFLYFVQIRPRSSDLRKIERRAERLMYRFSPLSGSQFSLAFCGASPQHRGHQSICILPAASTQEREGAAQGKKGEGGGDGRESPSCSGSTRTAQAHRHVIYHLEEMKHLQTHNFAKQQKMVRK